MKKFLMFLAGLAMTCSLSSCFGPDLYCNGFDPFGPDVIVIHDGPHHDPHHGPHHPAPTPHHPVPHHHYEGHGYRW